MVNGVEARNGKVRIRIKWRGQWVYETTTFKPTPAGIANAAALRDECQRLIDYGRFVYSEYFPNSPRANRDPSSFFELARMYVEQQRTRRKLSTVTGYRKMINNYWLPALGTRPIRDISTGDLLDLCDANGLTRLSGKTFNNAMTPLRGIFKLAIHKRIISVNPCDPIPSQKWQKPPPDPLDWSTEVPLVLRSLSEPWVNYFKVAFGTGMRTSELIALEWSDIDFNRGLISVERAYVEKQSKGTKTDRARFVELTQLARDGLRSQKEKTFLAGGLVFTYNDKQIVGDKPPRLAWNAALKKAGIRRRTAYQTRSTFISNLLLRGANIYVIAEQVGNSVAMIQKHYARWIENDRHSIAGLLDEHSTNTKREKL